MQTPTHFNGIKSLDHPVIAAADLDRARSSYERLGFTVPPRGSHVEWGTGNLCIMFPDDYIEIRGIIDPARFTMNLDKHLEAFGEGLMGVAFGTEDVKSSFREMTRQGMHVSEPRRLKRNFEHPEGWTQPSFELCVPEADDIEGLMHVVVLEHLTPELIRRPDFLSHANSCTAVSSVSGLIYDAERAAEKLGLLLGTASVLASDEGIRLVLPTEQRIELLLPDAFEAAFGRPREESNSPRLAAMTLRVVSVAAAKDVLYRNAVAFDEHGEATIRVAPEDTCGVILDFVEGRRD